MDDNNPQADTTEPQDPPQSDRTKEQFEKLTNSNSSLKEQAEQKEAENQALKDELESYKKLYDTPINRVPNANEYSNLTQQQVNDVFSGMVDQNGFLDGSKLQTTLNEMNNRAIQAEQRALKAEQKNEDLAKRFNDKSEEEARQKVYAKYPQLDPDNKETFDPKMWRAVYNELAVKAKAGELPTDKDYINAADRVYSDFYSNKDVTQKELEQKQEKEDAKRQINAVKPVSNMQAGFYANSDEDNLMDQVRQGKRGALAEMLNRRGQ